MNSTSKYYGIDFPLAMDIFSGKQLVVPYSNGVKPQEYQIVWNNIGRWLLREKIINPDMGTSLERLLEIGEKKLTEDEWRSLSEQDHIAYPVVLTNNNLNDMQRGKVIST